MCLITPTGILLYCYFGIFGPAL